jgi:hypothetical protein
VAPMLDHRLSIAQRLTGRFRLTRPVHVAEEHVVYEVRKDAIEGVRHVVVGHVTDTVRSWDGERLAENRCAEALRHPAQPTSAAACVVPRAMPILGERCECSAEFGSTARSVGRAVATAIELALLVLRHRALD